MVDPSKDQLYQQRLWGHLGAYGGHPSLLAPTSTASASTLPIPPPHIYDSSRLHPHFAGLVPNPSPGPPPPPSAPPSTVSYKEPPIPAYGGHYTHLAALSAAVAASDYSRPLPAHGQEANAASVGAPLPAHLQSRHPAGYPPTQAYHDAYANYYNQRVGRSSEPLRQPAHNGFDVAYGGHIQQQAHHQAAVAAAHKPPDHERNGYKGGSNPSFPPYGYPPTNGPVQQPSYHYPFDVTKIGYHNQHYANQPHQAQPQPGHPSDASRGAKPTPLPQPPPPPQQQQTVQLRQNSTAGPTAPTAPSAHNAHTAHTPKNNGMDAPVNLAGRHSSLPPSAALAALHYPNSKPSLNSAPPSQSQQHFSQNSSLYSTLPKKMSSSPSLGPLESALRGISGGSENEPLKRRPSDTLLPEQPEQKKPKPMLVGDPYKFDDDVKSEEKALELTRFGSTGSSIKSETPPLPPASSSPSQQTVRFSLLFNFSFSRLKNCTIF